jgi:demethylmenaquinone methyltransferase/2-methoxy-6-polyprenyl-1,4-benzoquinol methylase
MRERPYAERLALAARLTEPAIRQAIENLRLPAGSRGIDAGCGIGQQTRWLAEAAGPACRVTGIDIDEGNLAAARHLTIGPADDRVEFVRGDLHHLPFPDRSHDWIWCADTLWPVVMAADPLAAVRELARVVRPGGRVALAYWSGHLLLPGHPLLEARLNTAFVSATPYLAEAAPGTHFLDALGWLRAAGLRERRARTYVADLQAPLSDERREALAFVLDMFWGGLEERLDRRDWLDYRTLAGDGSALGTLDVEDYAGFITYTVFDATVA